jgi:hypothetical protein
VHAQVVDAEDSGFRVANKVRIDHVFHGEADLIGKTFRAQSAGNPRGNATNVVIPALHVGDAAIWLVIRSLSDKGLSTEGWYNYMRWPVREVGGPAWAPPYETIKAFAEVVERTSRLPSARETIAALERLATDANPYISSWAIARLPTVSQRSVEVVGLLTRLVADDGVQIQGQIELDRVLLGQDDGSILVEHHNRDWQLSGARLKLFRRWFTVALSKRDAQLVVSRLDGMSQHPDVEGFSQADLLKLVTLLVRNEEFPLSERQRAGTIMPWAAERYDEGDEKSESVAATLKNALARPIAKKP